MTGGDTDPIILDCDEAIRLNPNDAAAFNNRASAYLAQGQYDKSIADYSEAIRFNPNDATIYNNRAVSYERNGQTDHAIADYDEAIRRNPQYALAYCNRGACYLSQGDHYRAIADLSRAIELNPDDPVAYRERARVYYANGDSRRANEDRKWAIRLDPKRMLITNNRAQNVVKENGGFVQGAASAVKDLLLTQFGQSLLIGVIGGRVIHSLVGEAHAPELDEIFGGFISVACGVLGYVVIGRWRGQQLSHGARDRILGLLMWASAIFILVCIIQWWRDTTAIACRLDPRHLHSVCRLPDGGLQYWVRGDD